MKAMVLEHFGSPTVFKLKELPTPKIIKGEILIQNKASSVNPVDTLVRQGKMRLITGFVGNLLTGSDFSGTVVATKSNRFKIGDAVFGMNSIDRGGSYAELVAANENDVALKPNNISFIEAATLPLVALTAWQGLVVKGKLKQDNCILIIACTGAVGMAAVQIAKTFNATITGTCSAKNMELAKSLGVNEVIDYKNGTIPHTQQFDLIFDTSGLYSITDFKANLTNKALFISTAGGMKTISGLVKGVLDVLFQQHFKLVMVKPNTKDLSIIKKLVEEEKLKPYLAKIFPLEELSAAHQLQENGRFVGKIAIGI